MENKRGLSDIVTTVIIIALSLVAITVLWLVISQLISSNAQQIKVQQMCLNSQFEVKGVIQDSSVILKVKRTSGSDSFSGVNFYANNLTSSSSANYSGNPIVGQLVSKQISIGDLKEVSIVPYFEIDSKIFYCSPLKYVASPSGELELVPKSNEGGQEEEKGEGEGEEESSGSSSGDNPPGEGETIPSGDLSPTGYFVFQINITSDGRKFGFVTDNAVNLSVLWGDETNDTYSGTATRTHVYSTAGIYNISLNGVATRIAFGGTTGTTPTLLRDVLTNMSDGLTGITSASEMFRGCTQITTFTESAFFDDVSANVTTMTSMFYRATNFNGNISNWDTSKVTTMSRMFYEATSFNQPLNDWNTSKVTSFYETFRGATSFNQPIGNWDTSKVTSMYSMFYGATDFNQPLNNWDTSRVLSMSSMFYGATSFNQPLNNWDTSSVTLMNNMFHGASSFNQPLNNWDVSKVTDFRDMFKDVTLSTANYDSLLIGWASLPSLKNNTVFSGGNSIYSSAAVSAKNIFINNYNWTITDGGAV